MQARSDRAYRTTEDPRCVLVAFLFQFAHQDGIPVLRGKLAYCRVERGGPLIANQIAENVVISSLILGLREAPFPPRHTHEISNGTVKVSLERPALLVKT